MSEAAAIHAKAVELAKLCLRMTAAAGSGHPSSAISLAHIVTELMYVRMRHDPSDPWNPAGDRLVLSEGHAVPIVYAAWADLGGAVGRSREDARPLRVEDLETLRARDSLLDGHPNPAEGFPFFDAATGSLGMGLSVAAGLALAARQDGLDRRIYCIIGDGESREGQIWEAADFIAERQLTNVCAIFNCNGHGQAGPVSQQQSAERLAAKLTAFGWEAVRIDGHEPGQIAQALERFAPAPCADVSAAANPTRTRPLAIVAETVKGWGVATLLDGNWHGKPLNGEQVADALEGIENHAKTKAGAGDLPRPGLPATAAAPATPRVDPREVKWPEFAECMKAGGFGKALDKGALATRKAYGAALRAAGELIPQLCVLDGDVSNSTFTEVFAKAFPERFFECKIAEQHMISTAAGLAAAGMIPVANTFAKFVARAYDQVELAMISRANLKIVGSHAGISPSADGPSQMALADVAYFRAFGTVRGDDRQSPLCWQLQPADAVAAFELTRQMIATPGLCYMRTHRPDVPLMYSPGTAFALGGHHVLSPGEHVALLSAGYALQAVRQAAELLGRKSIRAAVVDCYCLPLERETLVETLRRCGGLALIVEDNYGGGLGAAVAEIAAAVGGLRVQSLHVNRIPKSTRKPQEEFEYCGVAPGQIADHALAFMRRA